MATRISKTAPRRTTGRASGEAAQAMADALALDAGTGQTLLAAPWNASRHLLGLIERLQQMQLQALHVTDSPVGPVVAEAGGNRGLEDLFGLPITLAAQQFASMARLSSECLGDLLDVEREWLEQAESATAEMARDWLSSQGRMTAPSTRAALELPLSTSPIGLFNNAQAALVEMAKLWVDAVNHDVQHA